MNTSRKSVLVVGAGGLGCPALWTLGASERSLVVGIADGDVVDASNLHRQILHHEPGRPKALSARDALARFPSLCVETIPARLDGGNADNLIARYDLVLDCTDSFEAKFLINDACVRSSVALVHGGVVGWSGQLLSVLPGHACFRCLFEAPPETSDSCATTGIAGPLAGVIGALMAKEALAILDGAPQLAGALLAVDGKTGLRRYVRFRPRPDCSACASAPTLPFSRLEVS